MSSEKKDDYATKSILNLLKEIDDIQIILLMRYTYKYGRDREWEELHQNIFDTVPLHLQSSPSDINANALKKNAKDHLLRLCLIKPSYSNLKRGETPEFDKNTGGFKSSSYDITDLGKLLLQHLNLLDAGEL